jgi:hypothetical protein
MIINRCSSYGFIVDAALPPEARLRITADDALALAAAISDDVVKPSTVALPSDPSTVLAIIVSKNGCRRIDVPAVDQPAYAEHGWMKLMAQNESKDSAAAARARAGAKIVHILPLQTDGSHPTNTWGLVEDGVIRKNSTLALLPESFKAYKKALKAKAKKAAGPAPSDSQKKRKLSGQ